MSDAGGASENFNYVYLLNSYVYKTSAMLILYLRLIVTAQQQPQPQQKKQPKLQLGNPILVKTN